MLEADHIESADHSEEDVDWRVTLFSRVIDWIQERDREYIPIIAHDDREDDLEAAYVWQLSEVIDL